MFSTLYSFPYQMHFKMSSVICFNLDQSKFLSSDKGLSYYYNMDALFRSTPRVRVLFQALSFLADILPISTGKTLLIHSFYTGLKKSVRFSNAHYAYCPCIWYQNQDQNMYTIIVTLNFKFRCQ